MGTERLQIKHGIMRSLDGPFTQSPSFNAQHSPQSPLFTPRGSALRTESSSLSPQHLFIDVSTELLRRGKSVRFRAPGWSMHPTIKEGEAITVVPVASSDIKRGDILLYLVGKKVIAHRVVNIKRKKDDSMTHSSNFIPQHLFILRGDASATCDEPVDGQQVLGKLVFVEKGGRSIDLYSRSAKMLRTARALASRLKKWIIQIFLLV